MNAVRHEIVPLCEMADGQEADSFVAMTAKQPAVTRDGKPYFRVGFRDRVREVNFPVWGDSPLAEACRDEWQVGTFYKIRAVYRETSYGPQLEIGRIRAIVDADRETGFDESLCCPASRLDRPAMFDELAALAQDEIADAALAELVAAILEEHRELLLSAPAARHNHHAFLGGLLEHTLSVARSCAFLADKYRESYPEMNPPLARDLAVAGGILHDVGKLLELRGQPHGAEYTAHGALIGHMLLGRDMVRRAAANLKTPIDEETLLRLEHVVIAHQRLPEWGSPKPPMTPEALIVHYADDLDAKMQMMAAALEDPAEEGELTSARNPLRHGIFRGLDA